MGGFGMEDAGEEEAADENGTSAQMCYRASSHERQSTGKDKCSDW